MPKLRIEIGGTYKWVNAIIVDASDTKTELDLKDSDPAWDEIEVASGRFARLVIIASGNEGEKLTADILRNGRTICLKRYYKFDGNGHLSRSIPFDPDA